MRHKPHDSDQYVSDSSILNSTRHKKQLPIDLTAIFCPGFILQPQHETLFKEHALNQKVLEFLIPQQDWGFLHIGHLASNWTMMTSHDELRGGSLTHQPGLFFPPLIVCGVGACSPPAKFCSRPQKQGVSGTTLKAKKILDPEDKVPRIRGDFLEIPFNLTRMIGSHSLIIDPANCAWTAFVQHFAFIEFSWMGAGWSWSICGLGNYMLICQAESVPKHFIYPLVFKFPLLYKWLIIPLYDCKRRREVEHCCTI